MAPTNSVTITSWMQDALTLLQGILRVQPTSVSTHQVLLIEGWNDSSAVRTAIARYLVGLRVCAIDAALAIHAELADGPRGKAEVVENVNQIIGDGMIPLSPIQITNHRNPWIAESIWHLCFAVAQTLTSCHPPGEVVAINLPHPKTTDHGVDLAVLYRGAAGYGLSIVESKAYESAVNAALARSAAYFREIDDGKHSVQLRQVMSVLRKEVPAADQSQVSLLLWQQRRTYIPNPHYDAAHAVDWGNARPSLAKLVPGAAGVLVMPHGISSFASYFEMIATEMRAAALSL